MTDSNRSADQSASDNSFADGLRQRAIDAYDSALDGASLATRRANATIEEAPLIAIGAGIAAGALIAALLPTTRQERKLLRPYGSRMTDAAREAVDSAREAGSAKLKELGLTPDAVADKAGEAARASAQAAVSKLRDR